MIYYLNFLIFVDFSLSNVRATSYLLLTNASRFVLSISFLLPHFECNVSLFFGVEIVM